MTGRANAGPTEKEKAFVGSLGKLVEKEDRAALAALRRGLGKRPGEAAEMFPWVAPWFSAEMSQRRQDDYFLVAALFAVHQGRWVPSGSGPTNLGASFRVLAARADSGSIERRFVALLNAAQEDLGEHLRHAVSLLKAHEAPVDWAQLLHDLGGWSWESRTVQRAWASAFWQGKDRSEDAALITGDAKASE